MNRNIHDQLLAMYAKQACNMDYGRHGFSALGRGFNWMDPRIGGAAVGAKVKKVPIKRGSKSIQNASLELMLKNLKSGKKMKEGVRLVKGKNKLEIDIGKAPSDRSKFVKAYYKIRKAAGVTVPALDAKGAAAAWKEYQADKNIEAEEFLSDHFQIHPSEMPSLHDAQDYFKPSSQSYDLDSDNEIELNDQGYDEADDFRPESRSMLPNDSDDEVSESDDGIDEQKIIDEMKGNGAYFGARIKKPPMRRGFKKLSDISLDVLLKNLKTGKELKEPFNLQRDHNEVEIDIGRAPRQLSEEDKKMKEYRDMVKARYKAEGFLPGMKRRPKKRAALKKKAAPKKKPVLDLALAARRISDYNKKQKAKKAKGGAFDYDRSNNMLRQAGLL